MQHIEVAAAIIQTGEKWLITQRPAGKHLEFLWEFPGGKREEGETFSECLMRECREELGITVTIGERYAELTHIYPEKVVLLVFFRCGIAAGTPAPLEGQAIRWVTREELKDFAFCPADESILSRLLAENSRA